MRALAILLLSGVVGITRLFGASPAESHGDTAPPPSAERPLAPQDSAATPAPDSATSRSDVTASMADESPSAPVDDARDVASSDTNAITGDQIVETMDKIEYRLHHLDEPLPISSQSDSTVVP